MLLTLAIVLALLLDRLVGDPERWHPLAGFGLLADRVEARFNRNNVLIGALATLGLVLVPSVVAGLLVTSVPLFFAWGVAILIATLCIGYRSLGEHVHAVAIPLNNDDLAAARFRVGMLVSRETESMDAPAIRRAAIESLLENASDAVFGSLFWFAVGGFLAGPGGAVGCVLLHRLINTLDAMWGYRTPRFERFGWAAARLDDGLNWLPARVTACTLALLGNARMALRCWRVQAAGCPSPNGGPVMSAGAGALGLWLGGGAYYNGHWEDRAWLGCGAMPTEGAIQRALGLVARSILVFAMAIACIDFML